MTVFAYLDAGTGSLIMQAVVAGAAGIAVFFKSKASRLKKQKAAVDTDEAEATAEPTSEITNTTSD